MKFKELLNKLLSVLITTLLVIQPLSGSITTFQNIAYPTQNIDLEKVKNIAFEYIGHELYSPNSPYPQIQEYIPKTAIHSIVGGALAELAGGDFSQGAIATAVSHNVAEYLKDKLYSDFDPKNPPFDKNDPQAIQDYANLQEEIIKGLSSVVSGAITLATHENVTDKELEIAQSMGESVAENNALFLPIIYALGGLMTAYDTYSTYQDEGAYEAVKSLMIDGVITAVGGGLFKVGGKVFTKIDDAYDYYKSVKNSGDLKNLIDIKYSNISTAKSYQSNIPRTLKEEMLWKEVVANPSSGKEIMKDKIKDPRFKPEDGWQKMSKTHKLPDGRKIEIHYQYNKLVDKAYDIKLDSPKYD
ncbi:hypothetical protein [Aliarcobacter butzleri]|uniref:hypothetical protein n=1 Tax=Aliarcobacter butzleri TaxID=28197 RepID=UPI002B244294|nr:hypothetical protein [Aliarcobacter butzleri]